MFTQFQGSTFLLLPSNSWSMSPHGNSAKMTAVQDVTKAGGTTHLPNELLTNQSSGKSTNGQTNTISLVLGTLQVCVLSIHNWCAKFLAKIRHWQRAYLISIFIINHHHQLSSSVLSSMSLLFLLLLARLLIMSSPVPLQMPALCHNDL